jgi:endonuclease/exonuclease/phosphatase family metal-dependent hydrolase
MLESAYMPYKVAAWNVQRLSAGSKDHKADVFYEWIEKYKPDVLGLIEVAPDLGIENYTAINFVNTLKSDGKDSQLCIGAYIRNDSAITIPGGRVLRVAGDKQKRAQLKVVVQDGLSSYYFYFLHATASKSGGIDAVDASVSLLAMSRSKTAIMGDFNYDLNLDAAMLDINSNGNFQVIARTETGGTESKKTQKNGGKLDFAMATPDLAITSVDVTAYHTWKTVDHAPILYEIA